MSHKYICTFSLVFFTTILTGQINLPSPAGFYTPFYKSQYSNAPKVPKIDVFREYEEQWSQQRQNQTYIDEVERHEKYQKESLRLIQEGADQLNGVNLNLPAFSNKKGSKYYRDVFDKMGNLNIEDYTIKDINFAIENAYFEEQLSKEEFDKTIKEIGQFLIAKMKESNYDLNSNTAKNFILFEFFTQTLEVKGFKEKHFPIKYDFDDYFGRITWSKMFVTKLLKTGTGQCHSMPLLYLILAEEIKAEASLALSPNHSYIKFQDEKGKWYNLELTNGMFTVPSFILNSGYIKAEAIQNRIYMESLSKKQLLSNFYNDLAEGYIHKYGYDQFVEKVINKALELYPNSINANMLLSNYYAFRFEKAMQKLGINPLDRQELQQVRYYPLALKWLNDTNNQYKKIDDLGYQSMPDKDYENWLHSLQETKNKQENETLKKQFKGIILKKAKD